MWTNHSETMVHYKFRFIHTLNIEREWLHLKRKFALITHAHTDKAIQDWCNVYTMHKSIINPLCRYDFWLKMLKYYYWDNVYKFKESIIFSDTLFPTLIEIENCH